MMTEARIGITAGPGSTYEFIERAEARRSDILKRRVACGIEEREQSK